MMISYKAYSTACTIPSDTLSQRVTLDSVKKLLPRGYYVLTEQGARASARAAIDAKAFETKWQLADKALTDMTLKTGILLSEREQQRQTIKGISKNLKWANAWKWTASIAVAVLGTQLIIQSFK